MVVVVGWGTSLPHGPRPHVSRYFWIRNFFFPDSKISTSTRIRIQIKFARPLVSRTGIQIHSSIQDSSGNIGNRTSVVKRAKFTSCSTLRGCHLEYSIHGKELDSILLRHRIKKIPGISLHTIPDSKRIQKFPLWRADSKSCGFVCRIHWIRVDRTRIRKEKVADSKISGYVWTGNWYPYTFSGVFSSGIVGFSGPSQKPKNRGRG